MAPPTIIWRSDVHGRAGIPPGRVVYLARPGTPVGPSLARKASNYAKALAAHIAAGSPKVSPDVTERRRAICASNQCGLNVGGVCQHIDCGCPVSRAGMMGDKLSWADQGCPHDPPLWLPEVTP